MVRKIKACKNHYEVLAVQQTATDNEVKKAYRKVRREERCLSVLGIGWVTDCRCGGAVFSWR